MKVKCIISGVEFETMDGFEVTVLGTHPIVAMAVDFKAVQVLFSEWMLGKLTTEQTHLLAIGICKHLPMERIELGNINAANLAKCCKVWNANLENMMKLAHKLANRARKFRNLSTFVLNMETIGAFGSWLEDVKHTQAATSMPISDKAKELNRAHYKQVTETSAATVASLLLPEQVDNMVTRALAKSPLTGAEEKALPVVLSDWAQKVTEFPGSNRMRWQKIVQTIFAKDYISQILMADINVTQIKTLEEHLLLNMPHEAVGTAHCTLLLKRIAEVIPVIEDFSPQLVQRRSSNAGNNGVIAAIMGDSNPAPKQQTSAAPRMSLAERLAQRLGSK